MLNYFIALSLLSGAIATSYFCDDEQCNISNLPTEFPESNEELQKICKPSIEFLECDYQYNEVCYPDKLEVSLRNLDFVKEVCNEETLLHAVLVDNMECFKRVITDGVTCPLLRRESRGRDRLQQYAELLSEEGLLSLNVTDISMVHECVEIVNYFACHSMAIEKKCGKIAMSAFHMMVQKGGPGASEGCMAFDILPTFIRLRKLEEETERNVEYSLRKKK